MVHARYTTQNAAARRLTWFLLLLLGVALMVGLYYVKTRAQSARLEARNLANKISVQKAAIGVLKAEIAYLESPERLNTLAQSQLALAPVATDRMIKIEDIAERFPLLVEASAKEERGSRE